MIKKILVFSLSLLLFPQMVFGIENKNNDDQKKILDIADKLATRGYIKDYSNEPKKYKLTSYISRGEILKIVMKIAGKEVPNKCEGLFQDIPKEDWVCKYAEEAVRGGIIKNNENFKPLSSITEAETLKMIMKAKKINKSSSFDDWVEAYRDSAIKNGLINKQTTISKENYSTRSFVLLLTYITINSDIKNQVDIKIYNTNYARYKKYIYYQENRLKGVDTNSFEVFEKFPDYAKDKDNFYYKDTIIEGASKDSFTLLNKYYSKDENFVYYKGKPNDWININSFEVMELPYLAKDQYNVFYKNNVIKNADSKTFKNLNNGIYSIDKNNIYIQNNIMNGISKSSFQALNDKGFAKDKRNIFLDNQKIKGIDYHSFTVIGNSEYAFDKDKVYFGSIDNGFIEVEGADKNTFQVIGENGYAKDEKNIYANGKIIKYSDYTTFQVIKGEYAKDNNKVYYIDKYDGLNVLYGYESNSFVLLGDSPYSKDYNYIYFKKVPLESADVKSFKVLDNSVFAEDKNNLYFNGIKIEKE